MNYCWMSPVYALLLIVLAPRNYCQLSYILEKDPKLYDFISTMSKYFNTTTDLIFVLDESGSVGVENFATEIKFAELITRMFTVSPDLTRVAVMTFSSDNIIHLNYLPGGGHMCNFMHHLEVIDYKGENTYTKEAVEEAGALVIAKGRPDSYKVMVLLSDGQSNPGHDPIEAAQNLKNRTFIIFSVGVANANLKELEAVASSPKHLYMIKDFNVIKEVNENLREDIVNNLFVPVFENNLCSSCDTNANCYCGTDGMYQCACRRGYNGTGIPGRCTTVECPILSSPTNGSLHPSICNNTFGATCSFQCQENYCPYNGSTPDCYKLSRKPQPARICQSSGIWSGKEFSCEKVKCPSLEDPPHGQYRCNTRDLHLGTLCRLKCNRDYMYVNASRRKCIKKGSWWGKVGTCEAYNCPYRRPPLNAVLRCIRMNKDEICSVACKEGYDIVDNNAKTSFKCRLEKKGGTWEPANSNSWPDCSGKEKANTSLVLDLQLEPSDCQDLVKRRKIARQVIKEQCANSDDCNVSQVRVTCRIPDSARSKRDANMYFTASFTPEDLEGESTEDDTAEVFTVTVSAKVIRTCNPGQLLKDDSCVNCPAGSYHNSEQGSCSLCPRNTYQDQERSTKCVPCPNNTFTSSWGAISGSDCLSGCIPGTFSETGLEQCIACPKGTYQDQPQQMSCKSCPTRKTTWREGTVSLVNCRALCSAGSHSPTGLDPCILCPRGGYQTLPGQKKCIACPGNTTTTTEGAVSESLCQVIDVCNPNRCGHSGSCTPDHTSENGYSCTCRRGFAGSNCEININDCDTDLCFNNGTCIDGVDDYTCVCLAGFTGEQCEANIDDCFEGACRNGGICQDEVDSYHCKCPPGLSGNYCEITTEDCKEEPCQNGGTCYDLLQGFRCCCPSGFSGSHCEIDIDECQSNPCLNKATCQEGINNFTCNCQPGFTGTKCEVNIDECESSPCLNHGTCVDLEGSYQCLCQQGFKGNNCQLKLSSSFDLSYPTAQANNFVKLELREDLPEVTVAFYMQASSKATRGTPVSFAHYSKDKWEVRSNVITWYDYNKFIVYLHETRLSTGLSGNRDNKWHHYAITWSSTNGTWAIYSDGALHKTGAGVATNYTLWKGVFVLGQEQDSVGSGFSSGEAFQGNISQFNVWNFAMVPNEIQRLAQSCGYIGNAIAWPHIKNHLSGNINVNEVSDLCRSKKMCGLSKEECHCHKRNIYDAARCEKRIDSCSPTPCHHNRTCVNHSTAKFCNCSLGLKGKFCQFDINECADTERCEFRCVNTIGSYYCRCMEGFTLASDRRSCKRFAGCQDGKGRVYAESEQWDSNCKKCRCWKEKIHCQHLDCPAPAKCLKNQQLVNVPGNCCPVCTPMPDGVCSLQSGNVLHSFDGNEVKFGSSCRSVLAQDCVGADFSIQMEYFQKKRKNKIQVIARCTNVTVDPSGKVFVNGRKVKIPFTKSSVVNIQASAPHNTSTHSGFKTLRYTALFKNKARTDGILITLRENVVILWSPEGSVSVGVPKSMQWQTCGLCGNFNGRMEDDMATRNNLQTKTLTDFILNWRVDGNKYCPTPIYNVPGKPPLATQTGYCTVSEEVFNYALGVCRKFRMEPLSSCYPAVNAKEYYDLCIQDACRCDVNDKCYCVSVKEYVAECRRKGINFKSWDTVDDCRVSL